MTAHYFPGSISRAVIDRPYKVGNSPVRPRSSPEPVDHGADADQAAAGSEEFGDGESFVGLFVGWDTGEDAGNGRGQEAQYCHEYGDRLAPRNAHHLRT